MNFDYPYKPGDIVKIVDGHGATDYQPYMNRVGIVLRKIDEGKSGIYPHMWLVLFGTEKLLMNESIEIVKDRG